MRLTLTIAVLLVLSGCTQHHHVDLVAHRQASISLGEILGTTPNATAPAPAPDANKTTTPPQPTKETPQQKPFTRDAEYSWPVIQIKADTNGTHYNLNQPAKSQDANMDNWSLVFHLPIDTKSTDILYFCGPTNPITLLVRDNSTVPARDLGTYTIKGVEPCP